MNNWISISLTPYTDCKIIHEGFIDEIFKKVVLWESRNKIKKRLMIVDNLLELF